jgi:predicted secreted protein
MSAGQGLLGRDVTMTVGGQTLLGVVTKDFSIANTAIEVTDDQSSGFRELLANGGLKTVDISISGPVKNYALLRTIFATTQMVACDIDLGDASTESNLTFDAFLSEYTFSGDANERVEFSATLNSSGTVTFTAGT